MLFLAIIITVTLFALPFRTFFNDLADYVKIEGRTRMLVRFLEWREKKFHTHEKEYKSGHAIYDPYGVIRDTYDTEEPPSPAPFEYGSNVYYDDPFFRESDYEVFHPDGFYDFDRDESYRRK